MKFHSKLLSLFIAGVLHNAIWIVVVAIILSNDIPSFSTKFYLLVGIPTPAFLGCCILNFRRYCRVYGISERKKKFYRILSKVFIGIIIVIILLALICAYAASLTLGEGNDSVLKEKICEYVEEHAETLGSFSYENYKNIIGAESKQVFIRDALGQDTIVRDVYRDSPECLQFYCGGTGNVTSSVYCGFYYSDADMPCALEFENEAQFTQISEGVYEWESEDGEKAFYTERILPKWFWYHQRWD